MKSYWKLVVAVFVSVALALSMVGCDSGGQPGEGGTTSPEASDEEYPVLITALDSAENSSYGFLDASGNYVIEPGAVTNPGITTADTFYGELCVARAADSKYGYINRQGEWVIEPRYKQAADFSMNGYAHVDISSSGNSDWRYIDIHGNLLDDSVVEAKRAEAGTRRIPHPDVNDDSTAVGYKLGSDWVIEPQFLVGGDFSNGYAAVRPKDSDGLYGYIDLDGNTAIPPAYKGAGEFNADGLAVCLDGSGELVVIDTDGEIVLRTGSSMDVSDEGDHLQYVRGATYSDGLVDAFRGVDAMKVVKGVLVWVEYSTGTLDTDTSEAGQIGLSGISIKGYGTARAMDMEGNLLFEIPDVHLIYPAVYPEAPELLFGVFMDDGYGFVDSSGNWIFDKMYPLAWSDGLPHFKYLSKEIPLAAIVPDTDSERVGQRRWGLIDREGNLLIEPNYWRLEWQSQPTFESWKEMRDELEKIASADETRADESDTSEPSTEDAEVFAGVTDGDFSGVAGDYVSDDGWSVLLKEDGSIEFSKITLFPMQGESPRISPSGYYYWGVSDSQDGTGLQAILYPVGVGIADDVPSDTSVIRLTVGADLPSEEDVYYRS
jgi:hypothetical protein